MFKFKPAYKKKGLTISLQIETREATEHYNSLVDWFYNYKQTPYGWQGDLSDDNNVEIVPMIPQLWLCSNDIIGKKYSFSESQSDLPIYSLPNVIQSLQSAIDRRNNDVPVKSVYVVQRDVQHLPS